MEWILPGLAAAANVHPLFVHFPIALLSTALAVELLALLRRDPFLHRMARVLVYLGAVAAVVTAITGDMAGDQLGHDFRRRDLVEAHEDFMLSATVMAVLVAGFFFVARNRAGIFPLVGAAMLTALVVVLLLGADRGGRLVFNSGVGVSVKAPGSWGKRTDSGEAGGKGNLERAPK